MDLLWIGIAFVCGLAAKRVALPPLLGYLAAGFAMVAFGVTPGGDLQSLANVGVTLMLFTIGLKLKPKSLLRREIGLATTLHLLFVTGVFGGVFYGLGALGVPLLAGLPISIALLLGFVAAFSSTVFAVKLLEDTAEVGALFGMITIGALVVQDIAAVAFLAITSGKVPTVYALGLLLLVPARRLYHRILDAAGHGELLILAGLALALGGSALFEAVKLKGDLGALVVGALFASHPKASELSEDLMGLKDLFLVAFFLTVGLGGLPSWTSAGVALIFIALLPLKTAAYYAFFTATRLRPRTAFITSLALANYSEFALIVGAIAVANGWLAEAWMGTLALAVVGSFLLASPLNAASSRLFVRFHHVLVRFETKERVPEEEAIDAGEPEVLIIGMGRVGGALFDEMNARCRGDVLGIDVNPDVVAAHRAAGRPAISGSASDPDFWSRFRIDLAKVRLVLLVTSNHEANVRALEALRTSGYQGPIGAIGRYEDEIAELRSLGAEITFDLYRGAGAGLTGVLVDAVTSRWSAPPPEPRPALVG